MVVLERDPGDPAPVERGRSDQRDALVYLPVRRPARPPDGAAVYGAGAGPGAGLAPTERDAAALVWSRPARRPAGPGPRRPLAAQYLGLPDLRPAGAGGDAPGELARHGNP